MLISVHDKTLSRVTFLDNEKPNTLHYFNDTWHRYLTEATSTFDFSVPKTGNTDISFLNEKGYVSFRYGGKSYLFNIMKAEETETNLTCYCENLNLELLNETSLEYKAPGARTFVQYINLLGIQYAQLEMGINEVSDLSRTLEWTGQDTKLARLLSLVNKFDAECEFVTHLNRDGTLDKIVLNVYRKHDDNYQGVGTRRNDLTLYYGKEIKEIRRTVDKTGLYTAIKPIGTDGLTIASLDKTELDADGNILFRSPSGDAHIYCPSMRDEYPSQVVDPTGDRYINLDWTYETNNVNTLYGQALAKLKSIYMPAITYEVDGFMDLDIGDTVKMHDAGFTPLLLLEARVSEQEISFSQPDKNKTTFANFRALENKLSASIQSRLETLIKDSIPYVADILTTDGLIFKNGDGSTTLTARVSRGTAIVTNQLSIQWYKDGVTVSTSESITVQAAGISEKAVYRFEAIDSSGDVKCFSEVTVANVNDGTGKIYLVESSDDIIYCSNDGTPTTPYIDFSGFVQTGDSVEKTPYFGRFEIEHTRDGTTWETLYQSTVNESSVRYHLLWLFGDYDGNALGDEEGNALGSSLTDVIQVRCKFYADNQAQTLIGVRSVAVVTDGKPTGLVESPTAPTTTYEGMLWKNTGDNPDLYKGSTYVYKEEMWQLYKFSARNIEAETLSAITANLGTVNAGVINGVEINGSVLKSSFDTMTDYNRKKGDVTIGNGTIVYSYEKYSRDLTSAPWALTNDGNVTIGAQDGIRFEDHTSGEANSVTALLTASIVDWMQSELNMLGSLFTGFVAKGRANVTSTQTNWLNILAVPGYSASNRYFCIVNCNNVPLMGYIRNDGRLIAYGPTVASGTTYQVDYVIFTSQ